MEATFCRLVSWSTNHITYTVNKIRYGLFSYALQPAKCTRASFMGAHLEEYLVKRLPVVSLSTEC